ncbi:MAG: alpha/beta hydrolase [Pseudomonadota bacterium]
MTTVYRNWTKEQLDAQYNNRARVPDFQRFLGEWTARSTRCYETATVHRNIAYGGHPRERLDVFPAAKAGAPVHVFFHGGYWQSLSKDMFAFIAAPYVAAGVTTVMVNYPLAPDDVMDRIIAACRSAVAWVAREIHAFGGDPDNIVVSGHSAGGHIAAMLMAADWVPLPADVIKGAVSVSGLFDLEPIRLCYLNAVLGMDAETARQNSPVHRNPRVVCPLVLAVGEKESEAYHSQTSNMATAWHDTGVDVTTLTVPASNHFSILDSLADPTGVVFRQVMRLIPGV